MCIVYKKKNCIIVRCEASLFGFNHFVFLTIVDYNRHIYFQALTILLCLILGVGLRISFHEFISWVSWQLRLASAWLEPGVAGCSAQFYGCHLGILEQRVASTSLQVGAIGCLFSRRVGLFTVICIKCTIYLSCPNIIVVQACPLSIIQDASVGYDATILFNSFIYVYIVFCLYFIYIYIMS